MCGRAVLRSWSWELLGFALSGEREGRVLCGDSEKLGTERWLGELVPGVVHVLGVDDGWLAGVISICSGDNGVRLDDDDEARLVVLNISSG